MRRNLILIACTTALALGGVADAAGAARSPYRMEILVDGRALDEYPARGATYVEALEKAEYSIRLTNDSGHRVAVALAVDGLNTIDARHTTAREARKWILEPHRSIVLDGWQTGTSTARKFFFTTEERSYGAWLGRTDDLGVISAAFFRERRPQPVPYTEGELRKGAERQPAAAPGESRVEHEALSDEMAATGIGRELRHRVRRVHFEAEDAAAAVVTVRYEYRDALVRLGVLPRDEDPLTRRERARGFADAGFAPDPFRR